MFGVRKPRGFHHLFIYVDERRKRLDDMEQRARRELGMIPEEEINPADLRGTFVNATKHLKKRNERMASGRKPLGIGLLLFLVIALAAFWFYLVR